MPIPLPPLRERSEDIEALASHFLALAAEEGLPFHRISTEAVDRLKLHPWRGNVRELRNVMYRLALLSREEVIDAATVASALAEEPAPSAEARSVDFGSALANWLGDVRPADGELYSAALAAFERPLFEHALRQTGGNQLRAAELLGINRNTLRKRLVDLAIEADRFGQRK